MAERTFKKDFRIVSGTYTTDSIGTCNTGLNVASGMIVSAYTPGYKTEIYVNSQNIQGFFVRNVTTEEPIKNTSLEVSLLIYNR